MRIVAVAGGSRGDVVPVVALGRALQEAGHEVSIAAGSEAAPLIGHWGLQHVDLGVDVEAEMRSEIGRTWLTDSRGDAFREMRLLRRFYESIAPRMAAALEGLSGTADLFISGLLSVDAVSTLAEHDGVRHVVALFSPIHPTRDGRAGLAARDTRYSLNNLVISRIAQRSFGGIATHVGGRILRERFGMKERGARGFARTLATVPTVLAVSPLLTPQAADWPESVRVTGPFLLPDADDYTPPSELEDFIEAGSAPVFLGFGSMAIAEPDRAATLAVEVAERSRQRIVTTGAQTVGALADDVFAVDSLPYSWLFPRTRAVVHHGGSGTVHTALRSGVPQVTVPHVGDQPYWGRRIAEVGVGSRPIPLKDLDADRLAGALARVLGAAAIQARARDVGLEAATEDGVSSAIRHLGLG